LPAILEFDGIDLKAEIICGVLTHISGNRTLAPVGRKHMAPVPNTWLPCPQEMKRKSKRNTGDGANQQSRLQVMNNKKKKAVSLLSFFFPVVTQRVNILARKEGDRLLVETTVELAGVGGGSP